MTCINGKSLVIAASLFFTCGVTAVAQSGNYKSEMGLKSDNDSYLAMGSDRYYTNGIFFTYRKALNITDKPGLANKTLELELGQRMYNARSGKVSLVELVDRPITAYLYAGGKLNLFLKNETVVEVGVQSGVMGPAALGEQAQKLIHNFAGFYKINGWQFQLKNEAQLNSSLKYSKLIGRAKDGDADLLINGYVNVGTTFTGAGAGPIFRLGAVNPLFQSVSYNSRISASKTDSIPKQEFFFYAQPMLNAVIYDATISGGLFRDDKGPVSYQSRPFVFSQELGFMYAKKRLTLDFSIIFKSKELKSPARSHQWGSLTAYYRFAR